MRETTSDLTPVESMTYRLERAGIRQESRNKLVIIRQLISNGRASLLKNSPFYQLEINRLEAWFCHNCKTVNGCYQSKAIIRKTCSKCKQFRTNELNVLEELEAIRELLKIL